MSQLSITFAFLILFLDIPEAGELKKIQKPINLRFVPNHPVLANTQYLLNYKEVEHESVEVYITNGVIKNQLVFGERFVLIETNPDEILNIGNTLSNVRKT
ncbi:MAG: hypothetical protein P1V20_10960, partial [Verrucomicrobiales bacterium]|nr:hypothetical protein [Verrucomicrobiales bacterium]